MTDSVNLRAVVLDILMEINEKGEFSHLLINNALTKYQYLDKNKRAFIGRLSLGTIENRIELDYIIDQFSKTPVRKMKPLIRNICEMSVYQIIYMDNIPDSAVCNEAVKLAAKRGFTGLKGFVNGVLRNIARNKDNITYPDRNKDIEQYLSVKYSMPLWIVRMWHSQLGIDKTEKILAGFKQEKKTARQWNEKYELAKNYYEIHGDLNVPLSYCVNDVKLGRWISNIRSKRKHPGSNGMALSQDRIRQLDNIGMNWK